MNTTTLKACACASCTGASCTCNCQIAKKDRRSGCHCSKICACRPECTCPALVTGQWPGWSGDQSGHNEDSSQDKNTNDGHHGHTSHRSNCYRMPDWRDRRRTSVGRRSLGGCAGTRDYRYGPPRVRVELGVACDAIHRVDGAASAMGGHARRFHGAGRCGAPRVGSERFGHRHARMGVAAASACADCNDGYPRQQGSAQSHSVLGRVPVVRCIRALRSWGELSNRAGVLRSPNT
jgi:hypothetical protein